MKKIEAIIRPEKLDAVRAALEKKGITGMTATDVMGRGRQKGITLQWRAGAYKVEFVQKTKLEIVLDDKDVEPVIATICDVAKTDRVGDGKIFIYPLEQVVRVRTCERGKDAI